MTITRRDALVGGAALGGAALLARGRVASAQPAGPAAGDDHAGHADHAGHGQASGTAPRAAAPPDPAPAAIAPTHLHDRPGSVVTPGGSTLPWKRVNGAKVFHLVAEPVRHEIAPGLVVEGWGYNGSIHGPTIEAVQGDLCRFYVTNRLPESTTVHWHGVLLPSGMDGAGGLTQPSIPPGETFRYEFRFQHAGTFMYHPHHDEMTQIALGMTGLIVVHPRRPRRIGRPVRDYALLLHEWQIPAGTTRPNPLAMNDFNVLTINGKAFPATPALAAETGDVVRIRFGNLSPMDHHPMHLHGHTFRVVGTDGGAIPRAAQWPETTMLVPVGTTRTIELDAVAGDWPLHCHMTHHVMNQMGHDVPNMTGARVKEADRKMSRLVPGYMSMGMDGMGHMAEMGMPVPAGSIPMMGGKGPFGVIDMGGMFTILKVRDRLGGRDPGWYAHPAGSVARQATAAELRADGVDTTRRPAGG